MKTAGYSGKPLALKLGVKSGFRLKTRNAPDDYLALLGPLPEGVRISARLRAPFDICHIFVTSKRQLKDWLGQYMGEIHQHGMIWASWPKKSSGVHSEVTEDTIREIALPMGLVDVKVCAVDEIWSGLKLVIRKELRR
jgi:hypothetical protein